MACAHCKQIRDAILHGKMAEAAGLTVEKLRESIGWKSEAEKESEALEAMTKAELLKVAESEGTDVSQRDTKAEIIDAIKAK